MKYIPVVSQYQPCPPAAMLAKMHRLADLLLFEHPEFSAPDVFRDLVPTTLYDAASIHVDDLSGVTRLEPDLDMAFYQDRARLRAGDGDVVLTGGLFPQDYEAYCEEHLGLGRPTWLCPNSGTTTLKVAEFAYEDRRVRRELVHRMRHHGLEYLHPHMGTLPVWELALLLQKSSRRPMKVIAPLPELTRWVNDKVAFTTVVAQLFGESAVPQSDAAWNESTLVLKLQEMAQHCRFVGVKLPNSAGGDGNFVFPSDQIKGKTPMQIRSFLRDRMPSQWNRNSPLLIDAWETDVLCSPSVQTWIPPDGDGPPVVEGVFVQSTVGTEGAFVGNQPAQFPVMLTDQIVNCSWLLASLFQRLGYVGRCSFDLILIGEALSRCHCEFIECNGRWGGTSLPMTLMNRMFGNWNSHPYAAHLMEIPGLDRLSFQELMDALGDELYDARNQKGRVILYSPGRMKQRSSIDAISLGDTSEDAALNLLERIPARVRSWISPAMCDKPRLADFPQSQ